jgi:hypothetical protein
LFLSIVTSRPQKDVFEVRKGLFDDISYTSATPVGAKATSLCPINSSQPLHVALQKEVTGLLSDEMWIPHLHLYHSDRLRLIDEHQPLNDRVVNAAQTLLKKRYPEVLGLMDTILVSAGRSCVAATSDSFTIQILHDDCKHHWFTITDKHCVEHSVSVLCSLQQLPSNGATQVLSKFIRIPGKSMTVNVLNTPKQKGPATCGLFAIAFAGSIVDGFDPCNILYDESKMRGHLMN